MKKYIINFIKDNKQSIKVFMFFVLLGLATGILSFNYINEISLNEFINSFSDTLNIASTEGIDSIPILSNTFFNILILYLFFLVSSLMIISPILLFGIYFCKGYALGILVSVYLSILGFDKGLLAILLIVIIPNLLLIPSIMFLGVKTIEFNYFIIEKIAITKKLKQFIVYMCYFLIIFPILILTGVIEQILFPIIITMY